MNARRPDGRIREKDGGLVRIIRSGIQREVSETTSVAPSAKPLHLRIPAIGTAGWKAALV